MAIPLKVAGRVVIFPVVAIQVELVVVHLIGDDGVNLVRRCTSSNILTISTSINSSIRRSAIRAKTTRK